MKAIHTLMIILFGICIMTTSSFANTGTERWTLSPWQTENMVSLGSDNLLVDFGSNGLWKYDGSWIRLSLWNAESMITWGQSNLVVDFGPHGLWNYNGSSWEKIALGSQ